MRILFDLPKYLHGSYSGSHSGLVEESRIHGSYAVSMHAI